MLLIIVYDLHSGKLWYAFHKYKMIILISHDALFGVSEWYHEMQKQAGPISRLVIACIFGHSSLLTTKLGAFPKGSFLPSYRILNNVQYAARFRVGLIRYLQVKCLLCITFCWVSGIRAEDSYHVVITSP